MDRLHMNVFELKRYKLFKHFRGFVAPVVLSYVLFRIEVRKLSVLLTPHEHRTDNHFYPRNSSIPMLTTKGGLHKILIVKDTVSEKLFIISSYYFVVHLLSPDLLLLNSFC